ncbi:unnamed protein product [Cuscuta campestris]|uniref:Uncharacterized protein n=1 Tax=Cuscuta campestris TaxID=132261 RepID=A0A484N4J4_9ASTE|nr:unnamed protein product [Cuscuta campestris]
MLNSPKPCYSRTTDGPHHPAQPSQIHSRDDRVDLKTIEPTLAVAPYSILARVAACLRRAVTSLFSALFSVETGIHIAGFG